MDNVSLSPQQVAAQLATEMLKSSLGATSSAILTSADVAEKTANSYAILHAAILKSLVRNLDTSSHS